MKSFYFKQHIIFFFAFCLLLSGNTSLLNAQNIYWTDSNTKKIQRANLDGTGVTDLITGLVDPSGIAIDAAGGKMYWTDGTRVFRANLNGSSQEAIIIGLTFPNGIALDLVNGKVYFTDVGSNTIERANLDGSSLKVIVSGEQTTQGLAIDESIGKMYWTTVDGLLKEANLDGSDVNPIIGGLINPKGLALDFTNNKIYWVDNDAVQRANFDGSDQQDIITGLTLPRGLAIDGVNGRLYVTDVSGGFIRRANLDGSAPDNVVSALGTPFGIAASVPIPAPTISNISPISGTVGTLVTLLGSEFATTDPGNDIYFGAVKVANKLSSDGATLVVTVPAGATSVTPITVVNLVTGLQASSLMSSTSYFTTTNTPSLAIEAGSYVKSDYTAQSSYTIATGDFNNDGFADVVTARQLGLAIDVFLNDGTGAFSTSIPLTTPFPLIRVKTADLDGDGNLDIVGGPTGSFDLVLYQGFGNGSFAPFPSITGVSGGSAGIAFGDIDKDGSLDLIATSIIGNISVLRGDGAGNFTSFPNSPYNSIQISNPSDVIVVDVNNDTYLDIVFTSGGNARLFILLNNQDGTFNFVPTNFITVSADPFRVVAGLFDGDNNIDLAIQTIGGNIDILKGDGAGGFTPFAGSPIGLTGNLLGMDAGDFDGDGEVDLLIGSSTNQNITLLKGNGAGGFTAFPNFPLAMGGSVYGVATADFNNDGVADIATANNANNSFSVLLNTPLSSQPTITGFSPTSGVVGTAITITGTNFNPSGPNDVYFGAIKVTANANATGTQITVNVPAGATSITPIMVRNNATGLQVSSLTSSTPRFTVTNSPPLTVTNSEYSLSTVTVPNIRSAVTVDFDNDGRTDIATANGGSNDVQILLGDGASGFGFVVPTLNIGGFVTDLASADLNNDGIADLVVLNNTASQANIYFGDGTGDFTFENTITLTGSPVAVVIADLNNDSYLDFASANAITNEVSIRLGNGAGGFATPATPQISVGAGVNSIAIGDFNNDGNIDLATANQSANTFSVLLGDGNGGFSSTPISVFSNPSGVAVADMNGDGRDDVVLTSIDVGIVRVYLGNGAGAFPSFREVTLGGNPIRANIGDLNGDGNADVIVANASNARIDVLLGDGTGTITFEGSLNTGGGPNRTLFADLDNDGITDLVSIDQAAEQLSVFTYNVPLSASNALNFDGINDYITIPSNAAFETNTLTFEAWVRPTFPSANVEEPCLFAIRSGSAATRISYHIKNDYSGVVVWNGLSEQTILYPFSQDNWYHIAFRSTTTQTEVFVGGILIGSTTNGINTAQTGHPISIGWSNDASVTEEYFTGDMDEVRVWNTLRACEQLQDGLICELDPMVESDLVAYYQFNEITGTNLPDLVGTNNGTLVNFALTGTTSNWVTSTSGVSNTVCTFNGDYPEIDLFDQTGSLEILPGNTPSATDGTDFGTVTGTTSRTFTIKNFGDVTLNISQFVSSNPDFSVNTALELVGPVSSGTFEVTFTPGTSGTSTIDIYSDDCDEPVYSFEVSATLLASNAFITTWRTDNPGTSTNTQITIPTTGGGYNYTVYWENTGNPAINGTVGPFIGNATIDFPDIGTYSVEISGDFPRIFFNNAGDREKILTIEQWGEIAWTSMVNAFQGCTNLTYNATDAPDLSLVTDVSSMFDGASSFDGDLSTWNMSSVTTTRFMFSGASSFNNGGQPLGAWDVSNVTNMFQMFANAGAFNQPINNWNVGSVVNFAQMFQFALSFNQDLSNWNMSSAQFIDGMFADTPAFNNGGQPLSNWERTTPTVSTLASVINMEGTFQNATAFNQAIGNWNISSVTNMQFMLDNSGLSEANYDATLIGWAAQTVQPNITLGAAGLTYCTAQTERQTLIDVFGWTINGDIPCTAQTYYARQNGNWSDPATWSSTGCGGPPAANVPGLLDEVIICNGISVSLDTDVACASIIIEGSATLRTEGFNFFVEGAALIDGNFFENSVAVFEVDHFFGGLLTVSATGSFTAAANCQANFEFGNGITNDGVFSLLTNNQNFIFSNNDQTISTSTLMVFGNNFGGTDAVFCDVNLTLTGTGSINFRCGAGFFVDAGLTVSNQTNTIVGFFDGNLVAADPNSAWINTAGSSLEYEGSAIPMDGGIFIANAPNNLVAYRGDGFIRGGMTYHNLIIRGGERTIQNGNLLINGNFNFTGTSPGLLTNGFDIDLLGNSLTFSFSGTPFINASTSNFRFIGANLQRFNLDGIAIFGDLVINNATGVVFETTAEVAGTLSLQQGVLEIQQPLTLNNSIITDQLAHTTNAYIFTNGASLIREGVGSADLFDFPVGDATGKKLITLDAINDTQVIYLPNPIGAFAFSPAQLAQGLDAMWSVIHLGADVDASVRFTEPAGNTDVTSVIHRFDGTNWNPLLTDYSPSPATYETVSAQFMPSALATFFAVLSDSPLSTNAFITTWRTDNPGTSSNTQITIPTTGGGYNYTVYWENTGNPAINGTVGPFIGNATIDFPDIGTYRVEISGDFPRIFFNNAGDRQKILTIEQWGDIEWTSMQNAFFGCANLTYNATGIPNLSMVTNFNQMFRECVNFNGNATIQDWDVSSITSMRQTFFGALAFNQPLNNWNVSNVTDMFGLFGSHLNTVTATFNQPLNSWQVGNVSNMGFMFLNNARFNQDISSWNVGQVTDMTFMFAVHRTMPDISQFNSPLNTWDVRNVESMRGMFFEAESFDQPLNNWQTDNLIDIAKMFWGASTFNRPINTWNVSGVTDLDSTFYNASSFNQPLSSWDVSGVTDMIGTFADATSFNQSLATWNISNVANMTGMLNGSNLSPANYDATLIGWAAQSVQSGVPLGALNLTYCAGETARNTLTNSPNLWTITGDALACNLPPNDACANALPIAIDGSPAIGQTLTATIDDEIGLDDCNFDQVTAPGVWYIFVGNGEVLQAATCVADYDTKLSVYSGDCTNLVCEGGNDNSETCGAESLSSSVNICTVAGTTYYILVHGFGTGVGNFELTLTTSTDLPEITVLGNGIPITSGDITPDVADNTDFGQVQVGQSLTHTFTLQNTGNTELFISTAFFTNFISFDVFGLAEIPAIPAGESITFDVTFTPSDFNVFTDTLIIFSDACPYTFVVRGEGIGTPPDAPVALDASLITNNSFQANWMMVAGAGEYRLDVSTDSFTTFVVGFENLSISNNFSSFPVTGLNGNTTYQYRLRAVGQEGTSVNSNITSVLTLPNAPVALAASNLFSISFIANWQAITGITEYRIDVATDIEFANLLIDNAFVAVDSFQVTGLTALTTYYYRVRAVNATGISLNSEVIEVTTAPTALAAPTNLFVFVNTNNFEIRWSDFENGQNVQNYVLERIAEGDTIVLATINAVFPQTFYTYNDNGVTLGITYFYRVQAVSGAVKSSFSETIGGVFGVPTALLDLNFKVQTDIYPNPSTNDFVVALESNFVGEVKMTLSNLLGQKIWGGAWQKTSTAESYTIEGKELAVGTYFLMLESGNQKAVFKLIRH